MSNYSHKENPPTVLVVDDDPAQRLLLQETLKQIGLTVQQAKDGAQALALFKDSAFDLVLMDIKMPVMSGLEACAEIRQLPDGKDVPIILITGSEDHDSIKNAFNANATDFITKPVNWAILNHRVCYLLKSGETFSALRQSENKLSDAQRIAALGNWEWDIANNKMHGSKQTYLIFGLPLETLDNAYETFLDTVVHPDDKASVAEAIDKTLNEHCSFDIDHRILLPDGSERIVHQHGEIILSKVDNKPRYMQGTVQDITKRKMEEQQIQRLAYYDTLTGLPNRMHFKQYANQTLTIAREEGTKAALMFLDLDEFKRVNDTLGHDTGDHLLKNIATSLAEGLRITDTASNIDLSISSNITLSRLGGDEFTIMLGDFASSDDIAHVAQRVLDIICQPIRVHQHEFFITASIGIAVYPEDGQDLDTLLKHADIAMYQAKRDSQNGFQFYSASLNIHTHERLAIEAKLRNVLERNELILYYQPQVSAISGEIIGMEALVRWQDPDNGLVLPGYFIPIAEELGLIISIGEWVLQTACEQAKAWQDAGLKPIKMSVNLSSRQFRQHEFIEFVQSVLDKSQLPADCLELEITESIIMQQVDKSIENLKMLKEIGVGLSIDDFGTGYSSMSYLKKFPLDTLKIDRSFIKDITTDPSDAAIIKAIIALAKSMGLKTVAEGVELEDQLLFLQEQGCDYIQGHYFSRALPSAEAEQFLVSHGTGK